MATYEWPEALDLVLRALAEQSVRDFEVIVADDGSGPQTQAVVERWRSASWLAIGHVWQPDEGWRKTRILNLAALAAQGEYLLFLDGDCLPRRRLIESVIRAALPGWFLAGKRVMLGREVSERILAEAIPVWRWSTPTLLARLWRDIGRPGLILPLRDRRRPWRLGQPEFRPPYDAYGFLFGVHRRHFEQVNGFDLRFQGWGGEDEDLACRLRRSGIRCGWAGPRSTLLHLWHERSGPSSNRPLLHETLASDRVEAVVGLRELQAQLTA